MAGFFRTLGRLGALSIAFLPALLGIEMLLRGDYLIGGTLLAFAATVIIIQEQAITPDEIPGKVSASVRRRAQRAKRRVSKSDRDD